jgi:hypothetical protein
MGSVIDYIECPNCKHEAADDFNYKTGEEYTFCTNCGYSHTFFLKRDEDGEIVTEEDGTTWVFEENTIDNPYGCYKVSTYKSKGMAVGTLQDEQAFHLFQNEIKLDPEVEFCSVSRFVDGEIQEEVLIDNTKL